MEDKHFVLYTEVNLRSLKQNVYSIMKPANERCKFSATDDMFHLEREHLRELHNFTSHHSPGNGK